ncbi:MAG: hypothetical protein OEV40_11755 [Acidimicrobiia bacterium]|nr:hypothetical protein [Acidimicrobiia bacterium]
MTDRRLPGRRTQRLLWLVAAAVAGAACSLGVDGAARPVTDAPDELYEVPTTEPVETEAVDFEVPLTFIDENNNRVEINRAHPTQPTVQDVLDGLAGQPLQEELAEYQDNPISTRLFESLEPQDAGVEEGVLRVRVASEELRQASIDTPERVRLIYGQIVCSLARLPGIPVTTIVVIDDEGAIPTLQEGDPQIVSGGVGPANFGDCETAADIAAAEAAAEGDESTTSSSAG